MSQTSADHWHVRMIPKAAPTGDTIELAVRAAGFPLMRAFAAGTWKRKHDCRELSRGEVIKDGDLMMRSITGRIRRPRHNHWVGHECGILDGSFDNIRWFTPNPESRVHRSASLRANTTLRVGRFPT